MGPLPFREPMSFVSTTVGAKIATMTPENFIINKGGATSSDYINIVYEIHKKVEEQFGVKLTPEIISIGKMTKEEDQKWKTLKG